jgi:MoaA/NifB/PqqE/SkfB family radical SAM enzyme
MVTEDKKADYKKYDADLLITTACPVNCEFCIYTTQPEGVWMPEATMERVAKEYTENDFGIRICGGEPFYDLKKLETCLDIVLKYQKPQEVQLITSGFFGSSKEQTQTAIKLLADRKLDSLVVSADRFHLKTIPLSSIISVVEEAKKRNVAIIVRFTMDEESYGFIDLLAEVIVKHDIKFEPHFQFAVLGKAELLDKSLINDREKRRKYFISKMMEFAKKYNMPQTVSHYEKQSPKRGQRKFAAKFYPTTFPNGNIYADTQCCKGSFMGNINEKSLKELIEDYSKTLPGYILWSDRSDCCRRMPVLTGVNDDDCDYCRNHPLVEFIPDEATGRQYLVVTMQDDFDKLFDRLKKVNRELLLSFQILEQDLGLESGDKIASLLEKLKQRNIRFRLSRPLPRCLFGLNYTKVAEKFSLPKGCFDCKELFTVENEEIISCRPIAKKGPCIYYMEDRKQIHEYFMILKSMREPIAKCRPCRYFARKQCDGLCFRSKNDQGF